jgi:hypothetical protein
MIVNIGVGLIPGGGVTKIACGFSGVTLRRPTHVDKPVTTTLVFRTLSISNASSCWSAASDVISGGTSPEQNVCVIESW